MKSNLIKYLAVMLIIGLMAATGAIAGDSSVTGTVEKTDAGIVISARPCVPQLPSPVGRCQPKSDTNTLPTRRNVLPAVSAVTPAHAASGSCSRSSIFQIVLFLGTDFKICPLFILRASKIRIR